MKPEIHSLKEGLPPHRVITVLYGETGKRKTTTACRMVKEKGLLVCADDSWVIFEDPIHKELLDKIDLRIYDSRAELEYLDLSGYDTVILDPVSTMVDRFGGKLLQHANWAGRFRDKMSSKDPELKDITTLSMKDYMVIRDNFQPALESLMNSGCHVIFTAHPNNPIKISNDTDMTKRPSLPNKTWEIIAKPSHIIGLIEAKGSKGFTINTDESAGYCVAKSRIANIKGKMDLEEFITKYKEYVS